MQHFERVQVFFKISSDKSSTCFERSAALAERLFSLLNRPFGELAPLGRKHSGFLLGGFQNCLLSPGRFTWRRHGLTDQPASSAVSAREGTLDDAIRVQYEA